MHILPNLQHGRRSASSRARATSASSVRSLSCSGVRSSAGHSRLSPTAPTAVKRTAAAVSSRGRTGSAPDAARAWRAGPRRRPHACQPARPLPVLDRRVERAVRVVGRAPEGDARQPLGADRAGARCRRALDLPIPGSPLTNTTWPWRSSLVCCQARRNSPISSSRPTSAKSAAAVSAARVSASRSPPPPSRSRRPLPRPARRRARPRTGSRCL